MVLIALFGVMVLAVGGCVCVVWAARGGPRWVRVVASLTLAAGNVVRSSRRRGPGSHGNGDGGASLDG
ncbi:hypothetical protein ACFV5J_28855 [Streptomyces zaomyceticus]|uniref:hypothetical protein n=1 Tax=Streptomyces zaomyceticus TaxID=68286 RepID=UPI00364F790B